MRNWLLIRKGGGAAQESAVRVAAASTRSAMAGMTATQTAAALTVCGACASTASCARAWLGAAIVQCVAQQGIAAMTVAVAALGGQQTPAGIAVANTTSTAAISESFPCTLAVSRGWRPARGVATHEGR